MSTLKDQNTEPDQAAAGATDSADEAYLTAAADLLKEVERTLAEVGRTQAETAEIRRETWAVISALG
jgi:hypothetical protein